jgi:hypothetical protein
LTALESSFALSISELGFFGGRQFYSDA